jgi:hypothetical protein
VAKAPGVAAVALPLTSSESNNGVNLENTGKISDSKLQKKSLDSENEQISPKNVKQSILISDIEIDKLLSKLTSTYEMGNLDGFIENFTENARSNDSKGRKEIKSDYEKLFNVTDYRKMVFEDLNWKETGKFRNGKGKFLISIREKGASRLVKIAGSIDMSVGRFDNTIAISELNYQYND